LKICEAHLNMPEIIRETDLTVESIETSLPLRHTHPLPHASSEFLQRALWPMETEHWALFAKEYHVTY
jgi:hypothetical protein